ncbi:hypothetical protein TeGR_g14436, partial [Tetraparma gracilis]
MHDSRPTSSPAHPPPKRSSTATISKRRSTKKELTLRRMSTTNLARTDSPDSSSIRDVSRYSWSHHWTAFFLLVQLALAFPSMLALTMTVVKGRKTFESFAQIGSIFNPLMFMIYSSLAVSNPLSPSVSSRIVTRMKASTAIYLVSTVTDPARIVALQPSNIGRWMYLAFSAGVGYIITVVVHERNGRMK